MAAGYQPGAVPQAPGSLVSINGQQATATPASMPIGSLRSMAMEDSDESKFVLQIQSLGHIKKAAPVVVPPALASGGKYDALLAPGKSKELIKTLSSIFAQNQPAPAPDMFGANYSTEVFSPSAIDNLIQTSATWNPLPAGNIDRITVAEGTRLIIVGDTHGQLEDVLWMFFKYGEPSPTLRYLFNGDFVDRSGHSLEISLLLLALRRDNPDCVYINRGNHEDSEVNARYGFKDECLMKCAAGGAHIFQMFIHSVWSKLPFMAHVTDTANVTGFVCVHGGIPATGPQGPVTLEQLSMINRCEAHPGGQGAPPDSQMLFKILWSDPDFPPPPPGQPPCAGRGDKYTAQDVNLFCQANKVQCIVRSHEVKPEGWESCHNGATLTIFSASNYHGNGRNKGAVIMVDPKPTSLFPFSVNQFWAPPMSCVAQWAPLAADQRAPYIAAWETRYGVQSPAPPPPGAAAAPAAAAAPSAAAAQEVEKALAQAPVQDEKTGQQQEHAEFVQFINEKIVASKSVLYTGFKKLDTSTLGMLSKAQWNQVMKPFFATMVIDVTPDALCAEFFAHWKLPEPVNYVKFLARFQIADIPQGAALSNESTRRDSLQGMEAARKHLETIDAIQLIQAIDPNGDNKVTAQEFVTMLPLFKIDLPMYQAATTYEQFVQLMGTGRDISVDDMLICLACTGQKIPPAHEHEALVARIGELLRQKGVNLASAFRLWDKTRDGFLDVSEIAAGLQALLEGEAKGDASKVRDLAAAAPPPLSLLQYVKYGFTQEDLHPMQQMTQDEANLMLVQQADKYGGYMLQDNMSGYPFFAKKDAKPQPQIGTSVIIIDPKSAEAQAAAVKQAEAPKDNSALVQAYIAYLSSRCADVNKVNILEFLRASVPRPWLMKTQEVLLKDLLKRVFYCKVALNAALARKDLGCTGSVSVADFQSSVNEINDALKAEGHLPMSQNHVLAVCELAFEKNQVIVAGAEQRINYVAFLLNLRIVDRGN